MKKLLTIALAAALTLAAAGKVQAAPLETKVDFRARYWYLSDYFQTMNTKADSKTDFWDQRLRLTLNWPVAEGVKLQVRADVLEQLWGADAGFNNTTFYATNPIIDFDWVNASFTLPGTPVTIAVGKMDVSWGTGAVTSADNRYRFKLNAKVGAVGLGFAWDKNKETLHQNLTQDDYDGYTLSATSAAGGFKFGAYVSETIDKSEANISKERTWLNAFAMGKAGILDLSAEAGYKFGKDKKDGADPEFSGLAAYLGAKAPIGPATLGLEFAYVSGDDPNTAKNEGDLFMDYQGPFWSVVLFNNFDLPGWESVQGSADRGVQANTLAGKASFVIPVAPSVTLYGAAVYASRLEDTKTAKSDPLGTELDAIAMFKVTENVGINVGLGYLIAGDFYGKDIDNPWGATVHFNVNF